MRHNIPMLRQEVTDFLRLHKIRLDTRSGQHFLVDEEALTEIVEVARLKPNDNVVEIGPGIGILTRELIKHVTHVTAIEIDERFIKLLNTFITKNPPSPEGFGRAGQQQKTKKLTIVHGNALQASLPLKPYKVVANIPYYITSPLLHHLLLESAKLPETLTLLIQREVAENICAPGSSGILAVLVKLFGTPALIRIVPKDAFLPPPEVDSAILHIDCSRPKITDAKTAKQILGHAKLAFSKRRKMLGNSIGKTPGGMEALRKAAIDPIRRPETLEIEEWIKFNNIFKQIKTPKL